MDEIEYHATLVKPKAHYDQVHIALMNVNRRGDDNLVFRYDALAPGQSFIGVIVASEDHDLTEIKDLLIAGDLSLGNAHLAGYGRVAVEVIEDKAGWLEYEQVGDPASDSRLIVTLLSPAIVRGDDGQVGWDDGKALARSLGLPAETKATAAFGHTQLVGGYNRKWSLPLPQTWALTEGSVFVFDAEGVNRDTFKEAMESGVGERRTEGFGRIAVNWQVAPLVHQDKAQSPEASAPTLSTESKRQAQAMAQRRLRLVLDRELARKVNDDVQGCRKAPEKAQIPAIRQAALAGMAQRTDMTLS
ncbi:MAG: hypothetical protein IPO15_10470 [Anaerolineae bacterium]|uniref:type III-B CRISPR module-associated Cmr3 family protein n=1 Tax=Candidatus Amarolinea dominans TaxID=3140696 RepID=UPI003136895B|nr:hypothetical protein [Anaerolineae bacterium]